MKQNSRFRKILSMFMVLAMLMQYGLTLPVFAEGEADSAALEAAAAQEAKAAQEAEEKAAAEREAAEKAKKEAEQRKAAEEAATKAAAQQSASENVSSNNGNNSVETPTPQTPGENELTQEESQGQVETGQDNTSGQEQLDLENARAPDEGMTLNAESGQPEATDEVGAEEEPAEDPAEDPVTEYTVTFFANGSRVAQIKVEDGDKIGSNMPADPTPEEGERFDKWVDADNTSVEITPDTAVTKDLDVEAQFTRTYVVTFDIDGETYDQTVDAGTVLGTILPADPVKEGYKFKGWTVNGAAVRESSKINSNMTVVAEFEEADYTVTYYEDEEGTSIVQQQGYKAGDPISSFP